MHSRRLTCWPVSWRALNGHDVGVLRRPGVRRRSRQFVTVECAEDQQPSRAARDITVRNAEIDTRCVPRSGSMNERRESELWRPTDDSQNNSCGCPTRASRASPTIRPDQVTAAHS
eukprot:6199035-Pleurochrysis_carterae.AAC.1